MRGRERGNRGKTLQLMCRWAATFLVLFNIAWSENNKTPSSIPIPAKESPAAMASARIPGDHLQQYSDMAVAWMQQYLRVDTTNPPGNEMRAVTLFKKIFDQEAIENRVFEY